MAKRKEDFQGQLKQAIPPWAIAVCAVLFAVSLTFRIIGIDVSGPLNTIFAAKAEAIKADVRSREELEERIKAIELDHTK